MIDAYEIGIQLLLQDDVSAGLAVINRGLAEVDQAIAATSANLAGLVSAGEKTGKAVATARPALPSVQQQPAGIPAQELPPAARATANVSQQVASTTTREGPEVITRSPEKQLEPVAPISPEVSALPKGREVDEQPARSVPSAPSISLQQMRPSEAPPQVKDTAPAPAVVRDPVVSVAPAALQVPALAINPQRDVSRQVGRPGLALPPGGLGRTEGRAAVTASIGRSFFSSVGVDNTNRQEPYLRAPTVRDRAAAPWSGVLQGDATGETTRVPERGSAPPPPQGRERSEGGGGTVMLDGRLVGQWLSDHMAREASRPPGGTSFFDPRQMPAWNISGAL